MGRNKLSIIIIIINVGEWVWGVEGKQVGRHG